MDHGYDHGRGRGILDQQVKQKGLRMGEQTMTKRILIVGAGGFGREVYTWISDSQKIYPDWEVAGFLDDKKEALSGYPYEVPIISTVKDYIPRPDEFLVMAIGSPKAKRLVAESLEQKGARFLSFVHHKAILGSHVDLGRGCVLCPYSVLTCDIRIGAFVTINVFSGAGHDVEIGDFSTLSGHVDITGFAKVGKNVFFGSHATVLPGISIGDDAVVGAGSVVIRDVKPGNTVFGNPAKVVFEKDMKS